MIFWYFGSGPWFDNWLSDAVLRKKFPSTLSNFLTKSIRSSSIRQISQKSGTTKQQKIFVQSMVYFATRCSSWLQRIHRRIFLTQIQTIFNVNIRKRKLIILRHLKYKYLYWPTKLYVQTKNQRFQTIFEGFIRNLLLLLK